jgi:hypothetical protein
MEKRKTSIIGSIFMYVSTMLALFITISGTIMVKSIEGTILQILFLPITIFLVISSINQLFYKTPSSPNIRLKTSKSFFMTAFIVFVLLMFLGVRSVARSQSKAEDNITTIELKKTEDTTIVETTENNEPSVLIIQADNPKAVVSVRKLPNELSPIIYQAKVGEELVFIRREEDWYEVQLDEEKTGWLKATNIEVKK